MKKILGSLLIGLLLGQSFFTYTLIKPLSVDDAVITAATATLSNPRRSFIASLDGVHLANQSIIKIKSPVGTYGKETTVQGLFPGDRVMIGPNTNDGGEVVSSVPSPTGQNFIINGGLNVGASDNVPVIATQSGILTVSFILGSTVPANGVVEIQIPSPSAGSVNDGRPDFISSSLAANGFDLNGMTNANTAFTGGNGCTWSGTETVTAANNNHTVQQVSTTACTSGGNAIVATIGDGTKPLVNPGRFNNTIGQADVYQIKINTYTDNTKTVLIETQDVAVAVVEGVLVSASVDETLTFTVAGHTGAACGATSSLTTTATAVPWGALSSSYSEGTHNASQQLTISTNSTSGYKVYGQESDQMGLEGNTCTGATPSSGEYTFSAGTCIRDVGVGAVSHTTADNWGATPGTNYGFGYSLANVSSTPSKFLYNSSTWAVKQFADDQAGEDETATNAELLTKTTGPINSDSAYVCFRINIPADQPAGYYYNVLRYTAVPIF